MSVVESPRSRSVRLPVGLLLSIGEEAPKDAQRPGRSIDWIRAKPGQLGQYEAEAAKFAEVYGEKPKTIDDIYFLATDVADVLDIRLLAFSKSGIRGVGSANLAEITDDSEFEARVFGADAFRDPAFTFFPRDVSEVRPEQREAWEGEPIVGPIEGRDDPKVKRLDIRVVASLEFCLPQVMGVGKVARISTGGRASTRNLWKALWDEWEFFGGRLVGIPFRLANRPRSTQRFDAEKKAYVATTIQELVIDTPHTVQEIVETIRERREALGLDVGSERRALESRMMTRALALPPPSEEEETREEPEPDRPDGALLNRIARMEEEAGAGALMTLRGVFGVETATDLSAEDAARYERMLIDALPAEEVESEVEEDSGAPVDGGDAAATQSAAASPAPEQDDEGDAEGGAGVREPRRPLPSEGGDAIEVEEPDPDQVPALADVIVPGSLRMSGRRLADLNRQSLEWALARRADLWPDDFRAALVSYCEERGIPDPRKETARD